MKSRTDATLNESAKPRLTTLKRIAVWAAATGVLGYFWLGYEIPFTGYRYCAGVPGYFLHRVELSRRMEKLTLLLIKRYENELRYDALYNDIVLAFSAHRECLKSASLDDCLHMRLPGTNQPIMDFIFDNDSHETMTVKIGTNAKLTYVYGSPSCNYGPGGRPDYFDIAWAQDSKAAIP